MAESGSEADARRASTVVSRQPDGSLVIRPGDIAAKTYDLWLDHLARLRRSRDFAMSSLKPDLLLLLDELGWSASVDGSRKMYASNVVDGKSSDAMPLSTAQVADVLGCTPRAVTDLCTRGLLPGQKKGRQWFIAQHDLDKYIGEA